MKRTIAFLLSLALLLALLLPAACAEGMPDAAAALEEGMGYWWGTGPDGYDMKKAEEAFRQAADAGSAEAWLWLGELARYSVEEGHCALAMEYYQKAADLGAGIGYFGLGELYRTGTGVAKDADIAADYFQKAIDAGSEAGYIGLGRLYESGGPMEKDGKKALESYGIAAESGDWYIRNEGRSRISMVYYFGATGVEADDRLALAWLQKATDEGYSIAYLNAGYIYEWSSDPEIQNDSKAVEWAEKAAACGLPYNLGIYYSDGFGVEPSFEHANELFMQAADGGRDAVYDLAVLAKNNLLGNGTPKDNDKAREYANRCLVAAGVGKDDVEASEGGGGAGAGIARWVLQQLGE